MIIGINGNISSGKDTMGDYLNQRYNFEKLSFAAKLKQSAAALFDIDPILWEIWKNDSDATIALQTRSGKILNHTERITVRTFLQRYGTEAHREIFGSDFWVDEALKGINPNNNYYFTDARFENELIAIKDLGGYTVRLERGEISTDNHVSEARPPLHLIDYSIENNGTIEDLNGEIDTFMEWIKFEEAYRDQLYAETNS